MKKFTVLQIPLFKKCGKCKEDLLAKNFYTDPNTADGYCPWCKECKKMYFIERDNQNGRVVKRRKHGNIIGSKSA